MASSALAAPALDFETLLCRGYRPSAVTRLIPRDKYQPESEHEKKKKKGGGLINNEHNHKDNTNNNTHNSNGSDNGYNNNSNNRDTNSLRQRYLQAEETSRLVLKLVKQTAAFKRHLPDEANNRESTEVKDILTQYGGGINKIRSSSTPSYFLVEEDYYDTINIPSSKFHEIELGDWESQINWRGCATPSDEEDEGEDDADAEYNENNNDSGGSNHNDDDRFNYNNNNKKKINMTKPYHKVIGDCNNEYYNEDDPRSVAGKGSYKKSLALQLLERPRNPYLDSLVFDSTTVSWTGETSDLLEKSMNAPLILELGVAGRSVGRHVYQNSVLSAQRPTPALKSDAYQNRVEREWAKQPPAVVSAEDVANKGSLHLDKEKMQALIEARQKKRAQMAEDKKDRVADAMGTMALGGGRGRTVTSSLMGPGGTERTGRPSRSLAVGGAHETVYIEQLDMVVNHSLYRDLSKVLLRQYLRPKLPLSVVRQGLLWQFQYRYIPANKAGGPNNGSGVGGTGTSSASHGGVAGGNQQQQATTTSYMMSSSVNNVPGAISKERLRTEADLSPTEGRLILLEYCEERPPIQITKGMCSKIVNYYRGDKARCPVSAGGGDRPARRKRGGEVQEASLLSSRHNDRLPRLQGPNQRTTVIDWVGKLPTKAQKDRSEKEIIDVLPEGITEILHPKVHGPFIGEIEQGTTLTGLISNLFVAPLFKHEPDSTDFLMILSPIGGASRPGQREAMGVVLRDLPESVFTVGQTEPRMRVHAPNTQGEKSFIGPFLSYQIACALRRSQDKDGHGLRFDELQDRVLPSSELQPNALRQRLKQVSVYDKITGIWTTKPIGFEDYPGIDALAKSISPESVATYESACCSRRKLIDLGIQQLLDKGSHTVVSVGVTMIYLVGQLNFASDIYRKTKRMRDLSKNTTNKVKSLSLQIKFYEKATEELEEMYKVYKLKHEVSQYIYEELCLAPWHLTGEFIDVHKKLEGTGMMKLTGLGDPSGLGEGFSFLREVDSKPSKSVGNSALNAEIKKITGTDDDLRKLTMKQMAALLRSYGMGQKQIDTLKRWDRVHVIRDLSTKAASDGIGDGLERFARGEKMKLSEQKQMYTERVNVIWKRQIAALSAAGDRAIGSSDVVGADADNDAADVKNKDTDKDDSDSDSSDDDLAAEFEEDMMGGSEANQLVAAHSVGNEREGGLGQLRAVTQNQDLTKDAREFAALKKQREEERSAQQGLQSARPTSNDPPIGGSGQGSNRKVIRRRITKTYPDGRQTIVFKFILHPQEVAKIIARLDEKPEGSTTHPKEFKYEHGEDESPPGHAMFEDEDDFEYSSKGRKDSSARRRGGVKIRRGPTGRVTPRGGIGGGNNSNAVRNLTLGKLKAKVSKEIRMKKRKREEEELEVYSMAAKQKGTSNRRERGSIRDRRPHVIFAEKLEQIRNAVEARPHAGPFQKPVNRRLIPRYYEVISHPIDLATIRDKIKRYEYRTADALVKDFELMKNNAIKFNGAQNQIAEEAIEIYKFVKDQIEASRSEFSPLEEEVDQIMSGKSNKQQKTGSKKKMKDPKGKKSTAGGPGNSSSKSGGGGGSNNNNNSSSSIGGGLVDDINIGDIAQSMMEDDDDGTDTDTDDDSLGDFDL